MSRHPDLWYRKLFSDPRVVEDLMRSFVHEPFVEGLDFSTLRKLNTSFVSPHFRKREADLIYEIQSRGRSAYIYLLLEFQSTVDRHMALRMARYVFEFYEEIRKLTGDTLINPVFPVLIFNGDARWTAPEKFSDLLAPSTIPRRFLPQFRYLKIAVNELSRRDLVKIRNAVSAVFYIENSTPEDIVRNRAELVGLLSAVLKREGAAVVESIVRWMHAAEKISAKNRRIQSIEDLTEVSTMWETAVKKWENRILEKGIEKGIEKGMEKGIEKGKIEDTEKMVLKGMGNADIRDITGLSIKKIQEIRSRVTKK